MSESRSKEGGPSGTLPPDYKTETLGVAFFDLSRFAEWCSSNEDKNIAAFLQQFYELAAKILDPAGCRLVKFMGDGGMCVFPVARSEEAIFALCEFSSQARNAALAIGLDACCNTNIHVGEAITGTFGPAGLARYDVIGKAVNVTALLSRHGVMLSPQAFRTLSEPARKRFQKITRPITYSFRG